MREFVYVDAHKGHVVDQVTGIHDALNRNIYDGGGQYISLLGSNSLFHHPDDRWPEAVDLEQTLKVTKAMLEVATQLARA